jgi:hypothetical protein
MNCAEFEEELAEIRATPMYSWFGSPVKGSLLSRNPPVLTVSGLFRQPSPLVSSVPHTPRSLIHGCIAPGEVSLDQTDA